MINSETTRGLRRELRFSRSKVSKNLDDQGIQLQDFNLLLPNLEYPLGLLELSDAEVELLKVGLGINSGELAFDLVGELISVKRVPESTGVSYGYLGKTATETNLGLVSIGFSDGIPRNVTNAFYVEIGSQSFKGIGRIAMDQCVIELGDSKPEPGTEVSFFGLGFPLKNWAAVSGFSQLEIFGRITSRVSRVWVA